MEFKIFSVGAYHCKEEEKHLRHSVYQLVDSLGLREQKVYYCHEDDQASDLVEVDEQNETLELGLRGFISEGQPEVGLKLRGTDKESPVCSILDIFELGFQVDVIEGFFDE